MKKYTLEYPVNFSNNQVTEIELRRPKGKHLKNIGADAGLGEIMDIAAGCSDYPPVFFDELDAVDYVGVSEVIAGFLASGR